VPSHKTTNLGFQKPAIKPEPKNSKLKELLHNPTPENRSAFLEARNVYNQTVESAKESLAKNISQNFCKSSFPPLTSNNEIVSTSIGKAELKIDTRVWSYDASARGEANLLNYG